MLSDKSLSKFRNVIMEFLVLYRCKDGTKVTPFTMMEYGRSLSCVLKLSQYNIDVFSDTRLTSKQETPVPALESHFSRQQMRGITVNDHKTLPGEDVVSHLDHLVCKPKFPVEYNYHLILVVGVFQGILLAITWELALWQFMEDTSDYHTVI